MLYDDSSTIMHVRPETTNDHAAVREIHIAAFANQPFSQQTEHLIVDALRADNALTLSLVAESEGRVVGHIAFSAVAIGDHGQGWYALGPVGVLPSWQRRGIGSELVRRGLDCLRELGAEGCVLLGEPSFYGRFGFQHCAELAMPGVPPECVLCLPMADRIPHGDIEHHPAFFVQASKRG
jgi:putative acetyltransferase